MVRKEKKTTAMKAEQREGTKWYGREKKQINWE